MSKEKYGITDAHYLCDSAIFNTETNEILRLYQVCEMLNQQYAKIADLEAKLAEQYAEVEKVEQHYLKQREYYTKEFNEIIDNLKQQLAEKDNTITALIEDSKASKELLKKEIKQLKKDLDEEANDGFLWEGKAREAWEEVDELKKQLAVTEKALKLAVADKCKFENAYISNVLGMPNGKLAVPKKEQWYLEQAEKELSNERQ